MKVSVIIPTYHRSECIQRAVDSVLSQTLKDIEVIVVDDNGIGTPDGIATYGAMSKYKSCTNVIYVQHQKNMNGAVARNTGLKMAKGEYISFLDDDDIYLPNRLEKLVNCLEKYDSSWGLCYSAYVKRMPNGSLQKSKEKVEGDIFLQVLMRSYYLGSGANIFVRREVIEKIGLFDETFKRNQDLEFLVRATKDFKVAYVDEVLMEIFYDIRTSNLTYEEQKKREKLFREKFSNYLTKLPVKESRAVTIMWDIDWIRLSLTSGKYFEAIKYMLKAKIPFKVYISYLSYIYDRYKNNISYGFFVRL